MGSRICKLAAFQSEEQLYATVSVLPYASFEELDFSSLKLVSWPTHDSICRQAHQLVGCACTCVVYTCLKLYTKASALQRIYCNMFSHVLVCCVHNVQTLEGWCTLLEACSKSRSLQVLSLKGCELGALGEQTAHAEVLCLTCRAAQLC